VVSECLDVVSHTIKEALVRSQPLNQESFNFQVSVFQVCIGLLLLPLIKATQAKNLEDSPFYGPEFEDMNFLEYAGVYIKYGLLCVVGSESEDPKWSNFGECSNSEFYIIGYTLSLFVIQYTLNSIMNHKFTR